MAYLNGNAVPRLLEGKTLAVKWVGTGLSVMSGVALGLEAPLVHLGACVASLCADSAGRAWEDFNGIAERIAEWRWDRRMRRRRRSGGGGDQEQEQEQPLLDSPSSSRGREEKRPRRRFIPILQSDAERREFVSAGVAAGLAAAFGAPIGGVLFAMEEASTHWSRKVGWRAFLAATATAVALNQLYPRAFGVLQFAGVAPLSALEWAHQLPLLAAVGALGGLMGAGFQAMHRAAARMARRGQGGDGCGGSGGRRAPTAAFVLRAAVTSAAIVLSMFALSMVAGTCVEVPEWRDKGKIRVFLSFSSRTFYGFAFFVFFFVLGALSFHFSIPCFLFSPSSPENHPGYGFVLTCPRETYNDLATLFFSPAADTASHIFSSGALTPRFNVCSHGGKGGGGGDGGTTEDDDSCYFTLRSLALLCPTYLVSMAASSATGLPGGLFLPSIVAGGSFGATAGLLLSRALPAMRLQAGLFAMVGATAALGGVFRASVALVVLVVEGTQSVRFLLAIAVAAITANWAGDLCRPGGVYESDLEADGRVVFLRPTPPPALHFRTAGSVAARAVWAFREVESVAYVLDVLSRTKHNGFPVVREAISSSSQVKEKKSREEEEERRERREREKALSSSSLAAAGEEEDGGNSKGGGGGGGASSSSYSPPPSPERSAPSATTTTEEPEVARPTIAPVHSFSASAATSSREGVLAGLILRSQLLVLLRARFFCDERGRAIPRASADTVVSAAAAAAATQQEGGAGGGGGKVTATAAAAAIAPSATAEDHHHDVFALDSAMRSFFRLSGAPTRRAASLAPALSAAFSRRRTTTTTVAARASPSASSSAAHAASSLPHPPPPPSPPTPSLADCFIDLRPFMDRAPLSVRPECPAERAHAAFVSLGLRHLPLTTAEGSVCGMLTRKDLDAAAGAGPWRRSKIAPAPAPPPPGGLHVPSEFVGSRAPGRGRARKAGGGRGLRRRARDFAAAAAAAGSAVWHGNNNSSSGSLHNQQQQQQGGGDERV